MNDRGLRAVAAIASCLALLLAVELCLRLFFGFPHGAFNYLLSTKNGLYPRSSTIVMSYGFRPYTVRTNSWGMRGADAPFKKQDGTTRIVALGDSVTDGFFVEDSETYPFLLERLLNEGGCRAEVLNVARGGGSIDKEYGLLKSVMPLKPDAVVLLFVNNDIVEIRGKSRQDLVSIKPWKGANRLQEWLLTGTAVGELAADIKLRIKYKNYKLFDKDTEERLAGSDWNAAGGGAGADDVAGNLRTFERVSARSESYILREPFSSETGALVDSYIYALMQVDGYCRRNGARFCFVYFPSYSQIYDMGASMKIRDLLYNACRESSIPFLDLTGVFRQAGRGRKLHFAPFDFHPNADGNRVIAQAVAEFLMRIDVCRARS